MALCAISLSYNMILSLMIMLILSHSKEIKNVHVILPYYLMMEYVQLQEALRDHVGLLERLICIQVLIVDLY